MSWNFGDILDAIEPALPGDAPAYIHGKRVISWGEARRLTNNLARNLLKRGANPGAKVAIYMRNRPEYLLTLSAAFKARLTHVNVNYRYVPDEVWYIFDNSDAEIVVYASEFRDAVSEIRARLPRVKAWIEVADDGTFAPFAEPFASLVQGDGAPLRIKRSPDDQLFIYTGGTTGMPKGVMWSHKDLHEVRLIAARRQGPVPESVPDLVSHITQMGVGPRMLPAPPLMHGTGLIGAMTAMLAGGSVVTLEGERFDPCELLDAVDRWRPQTLIIVGDSFGKPILEALDAAPDRYDVTSIASVNSSGVMWSLDNKRGLLAHMPKARLSDGFSSSEAIGIGNSVMTSNGEVGTARFTISARCRVFDEFDRPVQPGSGVAGMVAIGPPGPVGYYKDDEKSSRTFRTIDGVRYAIPGDWVLVEADGSLILLGRGNACINTAGEKVFPEEVEEALKTHPSVEDALVVGVSDDKWGQAVTGVVRLADGHPLDEAALRAHVRATLAGYKAPKRIFASDQSLRAPNGKADYAAARKAVEASLQVANAEA